MKKTMLFGVLMIICFVPEVYADCNCTGKEIISKINNISTYEKNNFISGFFWGNPTVKSRIVNEIKDTYEFKNAIRYYIEQNCRISNNNIVCR